MTEQTMLLEINPELGHRLAKAYASMPFGGSVDTGQFAHRVPVAGYVLDVPILASYLEELCRTLQDHVQRHNAVESRLRELEGFLSVGRRLMAELTEGEE